MDQLFVLPLTCARDQIHHYTLVFQMMPTEYWIHLDFLHDLRSKGWNIKINNLILSDSNTIPPFDEVVQYSYWNGMDNFLENLQNPNMATEVEFLKIFSGDAGVEASWGVFLEMCSCFMMIFNDVCTYVCMFIVLYMSYPKNNLKICI